MASVLHKDVLEMLLSCNCPPACLMNFMGVTMQDLKSIPLDQLVDKLKSDDDASKSVDTAREVIHQLFLVPTGAINTVKEEADSTTPSPPAIPGPAPAEAHDVASPPIDMSPPEQQQEENEVEMDIAYHVLKQENVEGVENDDIDDEQDLVIVAEVENVTFIEEIDAAAKAARNVIEDITLSDGDEEKEERYESQSAQPAQNLKRKLVDEETLRPQRVKKSIVPSHSSTQPEGCSVTPQQVEPTPLTECGRKTIFTLGRKQRKKAKKQLEWTQSEWDNVFSPSASAQMRKLSIISSYDESKPIISHPLDLPQLQVLKIQNHVNANGNHSHNINYETQLKDIIKGAGRNLDIEFSYDDEMALDTFLRVLGEMEPDDLSNLTTLSISKNDKELDALLSTHLLELSKVKARNLQELTLACCLWDDAKKGFEAVLKNFSYRLKKLKVHGCFVSEEENKPQIVIKFPKMPHLEELDMGESYQFSSELETVEERPKKKKRKVVFRQEEDEDSISDKTRTDTDNSENIEDSSDEEDPRGLGEYFPVFLDFPRVFPSLKTLILGNLFEIESFYFPNFPKLDAFRVASRWCYTCYPQCFPQPASRKFEAWKGVATLRQLQLPDSFQDCNILGEIMKHFPNVEKVFINLPTVELLRRFSRVMTLPGSFPRLKDLTIQTQFDFASSLNSCILDPKSCPPQSPAELEQIRILKEYKYWEDFVLENQIELPNDSIKESNASCGLHVLFKKLKSFTIRHIPRILRLPKGEKLMSDKTCDFTGTLIGFKEFPFSKEAGKKRCPTTMRMTTYSFDMSRVEGFKIKPFYDEKKIYLDPTMSPLVKKDEKDKEPQSKASTGGNPGVETHPQAN